MSLIIADGAQLAMAALAALAYVALEVPVPARARSATPRARPPACCSGTTQCRRRPVL